MLAFHRHINLLLLTYTAENTPVDWVDEKLKEQGCVSIAKVFSFEEKDLANSNVLADFDYFDEESKVFVLGVYKDGHCHIDQEILGLKYNLVITEKLNINSKTFIAVRGVSIFRKIDELILQQIIISDEKDDAISMEGFLELIKNFPTLTEINHYARSRISGVLRDFFHTTSDAQTKLNIFLNKKKTIKPLSNTSSFNEYELNKYQYIRDSIELMLEKDKSDSYTEKDWQKLMLEFILLIFPKYVSVLENIHIKDFYTNPSKVNNRYIDLMLVDANGYADIIEIKKPHDNAILSRGKYRDNYTSGKELSSTITQVEHYLFHLNKWGVEGEKVINKKQMDKLPPNMSIKITNPKGLVVLGRDNDFNQEKKFDFEIIRRKYANIIDILTYDDLLKRLDNIIAKFGAVSV